MPPQIVNSPLRREAGTASVELVGVVPFLLLAVLVAAQLCLAGGALWSAAIAARAGARAAHVGGDGAVSARRALPPPLREGARVSEGDSVAVRVRVPLVVPGMPRVMVGASSGLEAGDG